MGLRVRRHQIGAETLWSYDLSVPPTEPEPAPAEPVVDASAATPEPVPAVAPAPQTAQTPAEPVAQPLPVSKPPRGYYRQLLPAQYAHLRFALAGQPMTGVIVQCGAVVVRLAQHLDTLADPHAAYYAKGLRDRTILPVVMRETHYRTGELYLNS